MTKVRTRNQPKSDPFLYSVGPIGNRAAPHNQTEMIPVTNKLGQTALLNELCGMQGHFGDEDVLEVASNYLYGEESQNQGAETLLRAQSTNISYLEKKDRGVITFGKKVKKGADIELKDVLTLQKHDSSLLSNKVSNINKIHVDSNASTRIEEENKDSIDLDSIVTILKNSLEGLY